MPTLLSAACALRWAARRPPPTAPPRRRAGAARAGGGAGPAAPPVAVCIHGGARSLPNPAVYRSIAENLVRPLSPAAKVFAVLKLYDAPRKAQRGTACPSPGGNCWDVEQFAPVPASLLGSALACLRPAATRVFGSEAEEGPLLNPQCALPPGGLYAQSGEWTRRLAGNMKGAHDCMLLVEDYERRARMRFAAVAKARPDAVWLRPVPPAAELLREGKVLWSGRTGGDWFIFAPRPLAGLFGSWWVRYRRCSGAWTGGDTPERGWREGLRRAAGRSAGPAGRVRNWPVAVRRRARGDPNAAAACAAAASAADLTVGQCLDRVYSDLPAGCGPFEWPSAVPPPPASTWPFADGVVKAWGRPPLPDWGGAATSGAGARRAAAVCLTGELRGGLDPLDRAARGRVARCRLSGWCRRDPAACAAFAAGPNTTAVATLRQSVLGRLGDADVFAVAPDRGGVPDERVCTAFAPSAADRHRLFCYSVARRPLPPGRYGVTPELQTRYGGPWVRRCLPPSAHERRIEAFLRQLEDKATCAAMIRAHRSATGDSYQAVVRLRPDLVAAAPLPELRSLDLSAASVYVGNAAGGSKAARRPCCGDEDAFAIGGAGPMGRYLARLALLSDPAARRQLLAGPYWRAEHFVSVALERNGARLVHHPDLALAQLRSAGATEAADWAALLPGCTAANRSADCP
eukprot:TRINITY_DN21217_c1_g2_i2.p1 TRINITY_DN21217_c1_g2~~TRINITY_DN21217_c1_g2_i2.p1  ORF type:complete len:716 (+),score=140.33 TRINITY_DN21217_c1_g2_i2:90-2150(+)